MDILQFNVADTWALSCSGGEATENAGQIEFEGYRSCACSCSFSCSLDDVNAKKTTVRTRHWRERKITSTVGTVGEISCRVVPRFVVVLSSA